ncbi:hypothetical protein [Fluviispira sanaruensis]|uniref:Uncharacterized protein n=1 Tax=Fluviispira sanaruensis TaxID=2493639 RepID=A0A4P2VM05_FLUSA|nr:hypothetical protein [Fluviispira sanaruensis]BBH53951.1 hypothetical protein JCM31447_24040 [Fluviispira sanaruensis]
MQPTDLYSKKFYQMILIKAKNEYYIFPGYSEIKEINNTQSNIDPLSGLAIG